MKMNVSTFQIYLYGSSIYFQGYMDGDKIKPWVYQLGCGSIGLDVQLLDFVIASQGSGCEIMALLYASAVDTDFHFFSNHLYNKVWLYLKVMIYI